MVAALEGFDGAATEITSNPVSNDIAGKGKDLWKSIESSINEINGFLHRIDKYLCSSDLSYLDDFTNRDIVITNVHNLELTTEMIEGLGATYVIPEKAHGEVWKIPQKYTKAQIASLLKSLPATINIGNACGVWLSLESFKEQDSFDYFLQENCGHVNCV